VRHKIHLSVSLLRDNFSTFIYFVSVNTIIVDSTFSFLDPISVECFNLKFFIILY
jgi:hypothetical protein